MELSGRSLNEYATPYPRPTRASRTAASIDYPRRRNLFWCGYAATYSRPKIRYSASVRKAVSPEIRSRLQDSGLSDKEILLLLDMCLSAEAKCDERLAEAIRSYQGVSVSYLQQLKQHYANMRQNFLAILHARGHSQAQLQEQLAAHFPDRPSIEP